jgi:hypothetical protein
MSADFERFEKSLHRSGTREAVEGYDLDALESLSGAERARAEELIIEQLKNRDYRAAEALDILGTPAAVAALREALPAASGLLLACLAHSLQARDPDAARAAAFTALRSADESARMGGLQVLRGFRGEDVDAALLAAVDDRSSSVRSLAAEAVFQRLGLSPYAVPRRRLALLRMRLNSEFESLRKPAFAELVSLVDRLRAGHTPETLGLVQAKPTDSPAMEAWLRSIRSDVDQAPYTEDFDLAALDALDAEDRAWAELALTGWLRRFDPRAPRAFRHLGSRLAVEPMREMQRSMVSPAPAHLRDLWSRFARELARALEDADARGAADG